VLTLISTSVEERSGGYGAARIILERYFGDLVPNFFLDMWQLWLSEALNKHARSPLPAEYAGVPYIYVQVFTVEQTPLWTTSARGAAEYNLAKT
jgi:hypothetical protein